MQTYAFAEEIRSDLKDSDISLQGRAANNKNKIKNMHVANK